MLRTCFPWRFHRVLGSLVLAAGLLLSQSLLATPLPGSSPDTGWAAKDVDLRPAFKKWGLGPRLQGKRGTCSVFTVAGALEYALASRQDRGTQLSVEFLNWASDQALGEMKDGSFFSDLWRGFTIYGACPEPDMPYQDEFDPNRVPSEQAKDHARQMHKIGFRLHWVKPWDPNTGPTETQLVAIKHVLGRKWPVCGGFRWPKKPVRWKDDVLETPPPEGVFDGHSILLVGYRDDPEQPGGGVFVFRNSNNNGREGYMTYEYASDYMNDAVWIDYETEDEEPSISPSLAEVLGPLSFFPKGRNRRVSSNQQPGWHSENLDMDWLMPGESVDIPVLEGPGVVTHIWFTSHSGWVGELHSLTLRIYYDGSKEPGVEVPVGDFFAVGHGKPAVVNSIPVQVSPTGSLACYWRMPFRKQARIVVTNDNPDRSTGLYWQVDWVQLDDLPAETPYFFARYRQEYPAATGLDYLLADLKGSGYYVGTVMSVTLGQDACSARGTISSTSTASRSPVCRGPAARITSTMPGGIGFGPARGSASPAGRATAPVIAASATAGICPIRCTSANRSKSPSNTEATATNRKTVSTSNGPISSVAWPIGIRRENRGPRSRRCRAGTSGACPGNTIIS